MTGTPILVTGATGFIGSHLIRSLLARGADVRYLVRASSSRDPRSRFLPPPEARPVLGDLITGAGLDAALDGIEIVFHVAGVTKALSSAGYHEGNVRATETLLETCEHAAPRRIVHVSSLAAAGPCATSMQLLEDAEPHPISDYGRSKLRAEAAVRGSALASRSVIVRPAVVYGPRDRDVYHVFRAVASGLMPRIGGQESWFSAVYVSDLVEGLELAAQAPGAAGHTYFLTHPDPVSWSEFAMTAASIMGRRVAVVPIPAWAAYAAAFTADFAARWRHTPGILSRDKVREARERYWLCDPARANAELGFRARTSLREGISATLAWYREADWLRF